MDRKKADEGSPNEVTQSNIAVDKGDIAGRDLEKNIFNQKGIIINFINGINDYHIIDDILRENVHRFSSEINNLASQEALNNITKKYISTVRVYKPMSKDDFSNAITEAAACRMEWQQFEQAHTLYSDALDDSSNERYIFFFKQYLITGFIHFSQKNDMLGLRNLLSKAMKFSADDVEIDLIKANIFQEICSRDTDLKGLSDYIKTLEDLYNSAPATITATMANSLGLAYRRLGERMGIEFLQKSILIFDEGLKLSADNLVLEVDLKDQKAITYVRIFEFNKDKNDLSIAEKILIECVNSFKKLIDFQGVRLKPRILNNIGNVYKQKALILDSGKIKNANKAISYYKDAEEFWDEPTAKYEWALLQKNKAEAKFALAEAISDYNLSIDALKDCISSIKYRDLENSPYQWQKSVEIIFKITLLLKRLRRINDIPKDIKEKILLYTMQVDSDQSRWDIVDLVNNAKEIKNALQAN